MDMTGLHRLLLTDLLQKGCFSSVHTRPPLGHYTLTWNNADGLLSRPYWFEQCRNTLPSELETLAMVLSKHSFSTAAVVNSFFVSEKFGFNRSFDYFCFVPENHAPIGAAPIIIKQAMQWMQQHKNQKDFLFLYFYDVHGNYCSLPRYEKQFVVRYNGVVGGTLAQLIEFRKGNLL